MTPYEALASLFGALALVSAGFVLGTFAASLWTDWCDDQRRKRAPRVVWQTTFTREEADARERDR